MKRSRTVILLAGLLALVFASPVIAQNSLAVTNAAAIDGTYGLAVTLDGSSNKTFVRDESPVDEHIYRATFKVDVNNLVMNDMDWHFIATWRAEVGGPDNNPTPRNLMRLQLQYRQGQTRPHKIRFIARNDDRSWNQPGGHSLLITGPQTVTVEWKASSAPGANDGFARFYQNGILRATASNLDNDTWAGVSSATLGVDSQVDAGTSGTIYYDSFESFRTLQ